MPTSLAARGPACRSRVSLAFRPRGDRDRCCGAYARRRACPVMAAASPGFLRHSGSFGISAEIGLRGQEPIDVALLGLGFTRQGSGNHIALTLCSVGPWDRGNLCRRPAACRAGAGDAPEGAGRRAGGGARHAARRGVRQVGAGRRVLSCAATSSHRRWGSRPRGRVLHRPHATPRRIFASPRRIFASSCATSRSPGPARHPSQRRRRHARRRAPTRARVCAATKP
jgi:hypothetical protein